MDPVAAVASSEAAMDLPTAPPTPAPEQPATPLPLPAFTPGKGLGTLLDTSSVFMTPALRAPTTVQPSDDSQHQHSSSNVASDLQARADLLVFRISDLMNAGAPQEEIDRLSAHLDFLERQIASRRPTPTVAAPLLQPTVTYVHDTSTSNSGFKLPSALEKLVRTSLPPGEAEYWLRDVSRKINIVYSAEVRDTHAMRALMLLLPEPLQRKIHWIMRDRHSEMMTWPIQLKLATHALSNNSDQDAKTKEFVGISFYPPVESLQDFEARFDFTRSRAIGPNVPLNPLDAHILLSSLPTPMRAEIWRMYEQELMLQQQTDSVLTAEDRLRLESLDDDIVLPVIDAAAIARITTHLESQRVPLTVPKIWKLLRVLLADSSAGAANARRLGRAERDAESVKQLMYYNYNAAATANVPAVAAARPAGRLPRVSHASTPVTQSAPDAPCCLPEHNPNPTHTNATCYKQKSLKIASGFDSQALAQPSSRVGNSSGGPPRSSTPNRPIPQQISGVSHSAAPPTLSASPARTPITALATHGSSSDPKSAKISNRQ